MIRKLDQDTDENLIRMAFFWRDDAPRWFREMRANSGPGETWEEWEAMKRDTFLEFGVFDDNEMYGLISLSPEGAGRFSAHISAKRGASGEELAFAAFAVRDWMFKHGAKEIYAWVMSRHRSLKRLCLLCGMRPDTVTMIKGQMRNKLILWERYSARPEVI